MSAQDRASHGVPCPFCGAKAGSPCKRPSEYEALAPHMARVKAAQKTGRVEPYRNVARRRRGPMCETCGTTNGPVSGQPPTCSGCSEERHRHDPGVSTMYAFRGRVSYAREENEPLAFLTQAELCAMGQHPLVVFEGREMGKCDACGRSVRMDEFDPFRDLDDQPPPRPDEPDESDLDEGDEAIRDDFADDADRDMLNGWNLKRPADDGP